MYREQTWKHVPEAPEISGEHRSVQGPVYTGLPRNYSITTSYPGRVYRGQIPGKVSPQGSPSGRLEFLSDQYIFAQLRKTDNFSSCVNTNYVTFWIQENKEIIWGVMERKAARTALISQLVFITHFFLDWDNWKIISNMNAWCCCAVFKTPPQRGVGATGIPHLHPAPCLSLLLWENETPFAYQSLPCLGSQSSLDTNWYDLVSSSVI